MRFLTPSLIALTIAFAFWRFGENSADPDLWGHVLYGETHLLGGNLPAGDPYSWTAAGAPWINHEVGAELVMAAAHLAGGSAGLWVLMVAVAAATLALAWREARARLSPDAGWLAWLILLLASREIAVGFAMRPQIFSLLGWALFLTGLRALLAGRRLAWFLLPAGFVVWVNVHGGVLLALLALGVVALALSGLTVMGRAGLLPAGAIERVMPGQGPRLPGLWLAAGLGTAGLFLNPYGWRLPVWLVESVRYVRPEISEWNPPALAPGHALFWLLAGLWLALIFVRRTRLPAWEALVGCLVLAAAVRHERHIPFFALAMAVFVPGALERWALSGAWWSPHLLKLGERPAFVRLLVTINAVAALAFFACGAGCGKVRFWRLEVSRSEYPVAAMDYIRTAKIRGNAIVYFDWSQQALWMLPDSRVSLDGRLDTCYSRGLIAEHWRFFHDGVLPKETFSIDRADWALVPTGGAASAALAGTMTWRRSYGDRLAEVFVNTARLAATGSLVFGGPAATQGRESFPDAAASADNSPGKNLIRR